MQAIILGVLLYAAFFFALLLVFAMGAALVASRSESEEPPEEEWRHGHAGYGLYNQYEWRLDQHDPNRPEDDVV